MTVAIITKNHLYILLFNITGIFVDYPAWLSAKSANSAGGFISRLLVNLFPLEVLLRSNLKGGASKVKKGEEEQKLKLDPKKISALKCK